jgi:hypothetical protein
VLCCGFVVQAAEQAQVESEAKLIAFDRQNHMGISSKTAQKIQDAITAEAATMHDAKGAKAVVNIKDNEVKMKQMKVGGLCGVCTGGCVCRGPS